jgi:hypothetical protein
MDSNSQTVGFETWLVDVTANRVSQRIWRDTGSQYVYLLGVFNDPHEQGSFLVLLEGVSESPNPDEGPGVLAISCPSGKVRWRSLLTDFGWFSGASFYDAESVLVAEESKDPRNTEIQRTRVWQINLVNGKLRLLSMVPDTCHWITVLRSDASQPLVFIGDSDIWLIAGPGVKTPRRILRNSVRGASSAAGVRVDPVRGVDAYAVTSHNVWRCSFKDRTTQSIYSTPGANADEPPQIVGGL